MCRAVLLPTVSQSLGVYIFLLYVALAVFAPSVIVRAVLLWASVQERPLSLESVPYGAVLSLVSRLAPTPTPYFVSQVMGRGL